MYIAAETFKHGEITHTVGEVVHNPTNEMLEKGQVIRDSSIPKQAPIAPKKVVEVVEVVEPVLDVANTETTETSETTETTEEILLIEDSADVSIEISDTVQTDSTVI